METDCAEAECVKVRLDCEDKLLPDEEEASFPFTTLLTNVLDTIRLKQPIVACILVEE